MLKGTDDKYVVKKGFFECAFCSSDHCAPKGFDQPMTLQVNKYVRDEVAKKAGQVLIYCEEHPHLFVHRYCLKHQQLICTECGFSQVHADHAQDTKAINQEGIVQYM